MPHKKIRNGGKYMYYLLSPDQEECIPTHEIVANIENGLIANVNWSECQIIGDCRCSPPHLRLILSLLEAWPESLPMKALLPLALYRENPQHVALWLDQATGQGTLTILLRPLMQLIEQCQTLLNPLSLAIVENRALSQDHREYRLVFLE